MIASSVRHGRSSDVAVIEVYSGPAFLWAEITAGILRFLKRPVVLVLHGGNLPSFSKNNQKRVSRLLTNADAVVSPSHFLQLAMSEFRKDIKVIPNAIDLIDAAADEEVRVRADIAWLRAFHAIYNPALAVKVLKMVLDKFPEATMTMYGPDKGDGSLQDTKRIAEELGILDRIVFAGQIPKIDVQKKLSDHSIFINTTNVDNTPVSVIEAMAARLAIVSTDVGGIPDLLENEKTTLLVPPNDVDAMAEAVVRILTEDGLAERLSTNARRQAEKYSWDIVIPQWEQLFEQVIAKSREGRKN
jgi:glycosyltransferase involved in cell wall biosynthesis